MEEKTLLEFLIGLDKETTVNVYIYINGCYRLVLVNKAKELLRCLSKGMLKTRFYLYVRDLKIDDLETMDIYIQELA